MQSQTVAIVTEAIRYIESHLGAPLGLDQVAAALHYSKYHLHRSFTKATGITLHDYVSRRRLTEAARLLTDTRRPILDIAFQSGYGSQQAFTDSFRAMYKTTPARFRETEAFYPLQHALRLQECPFRLHLPKENIRPAAPQDLDDWMELLGLSVDGYPRLNEAEYRKDLRRHMDAGEAFLLQDDDRVVGALAFTAAGGHVEFLAVHPQYRSLGVAGLLLDKLREDLLPGSPLTITTYRKGDRADTGYREEYRRLGFQEQELSVEYGYPVQRFTLPPGNISAQNVGSIFRQTSGHPSGPAPRHKEETRREPD